MNSNVLAITGLGMVSSLGWSAISSCAAARAGISRAAELNHFQLWDEQDHEPLPVIGHQVPQRIDGFQGTGRLARLGMLALQDLQQQMDLSKSVFARTGLFINLASSYYREQATARRLMLHQAEQSDDQAVNDGEPQLRALLPALLLKFSGIGIPPEHCRVGFGDQAGVLDLILQAAELLQQGTLDRCIVGGIDSNIDPERLEDLSTLGLLKGPNSPNGLIPGESAAFILVERYDNVRLRVTKVQGLLEMPVVMREPIHRFSDRASIGVALSEAVAQIIMPVNGNREIPRVLIGGLNGDRWRAVEWGCAWVRLRAQGISDEVEEWYPAVSFGETGAAAGAVAIVMAVRAFVRGYAKGKRIAIWASSDSGLKAASCVYQT